MASAPTTPPRQSASEIVRAMRERNAPRRERVLRSIERLREMARAKQRRG